MVNPERRATGYVLGVRTTGARCILLLSPYGTNEYSPAFQRRVCLAGPVSASCFAVRFLSLAEA